MRINRRSRRNTGLAVRPWSRRGPLVVLLAGLLCELKYRVEAHYNGRDASLVAICERVAHCEPCSRSRYSCHPYPAEPVAVTHARAINSSLCIQNSRRKGERGRGLFSELLVLCPRARRQRAAIHHVATITRMDAILIRWSLLRHLRKQ